MTVVSHESEAKESLFCLAAARVLAFDSNSKNVGNYTNAGITVVISSRRKTQDREPLS